MKARGCSPRRFRKNSLRTSMISTELSTKSIFSIEDKSSLGVVLLQSTPIPLQIIARTLIMSTETELQAFESIARSFQLYEVRSPGRKAIQFDTYANNASSVLSVRFFLTFACPRTRFLADLICSCDSHRACKSLRIYHPKRSF